MSGVTRLGIYSDTLPSRAEDYAAVIAARGSFQVAKSLAGHPVTPADRSAGELPEDLAWIYRGDQPGYVITSYGTPIAWHVPGKHVWRVPNVRYSVTTTQHQHLIRDALKLGPRSPAGRRSWTRHRGRTAPRPTTLPSPR